MKFQPLNQRVLVNQHQTSEKSGSIIVPDAAKKKLSSGQLMKVGDDSKLKVGQTVYFSTYTSNEINIGGEIYLVVKEEDLLGVE